MPHLSCKRDQCTHFYFIYFFIVRNTVKSNYTWGLGYSLEEGRLKKSKEVVILSEIKLSVEFLASTLLSAYING